MDVQIQTFEAVEFGNELKDFGSQYGANLKWSSAPVFV